jgi:hypothetical protein
VNSLQRRLHGLEASGNPLQWAVKVLGDLADGAGPVSLNLLRQVRGLFDGSEHVGPRMLTYFAYDTHHNSYY